MSRAVADSVDELSVIVVEFVDVSVVADGIVAVGIPTFLSRNRRLFGGNVSMSVVGFECFGFVVELLVLLSSPAPVLEHELASSLA